MQFDQRSGTQSQASGISFRKTFAQKAVQQQLRFEFRASPSELDFTDNIAKIEPLGLFFRSAQDPLQTTPQVRSLANVRLAFTAQHEHRSRSREFLKKTLAVLRREA